MLKINELTMRVSVCIQIPLCHSITLSHVAVTLTLQSEFEAINIHAEARTSGQTGELPSHVS